MIKYSLVEKGNCDEAWWEIHKHEDGQAVKVPRIGFDHNFTYQTKVSAETDFKLRVRAAKQQKMRKESYYTKVLEEEEI